MKIAMVSEHASPLAVIGGVDAGGQNVYVAALAQELGRRGEQVVVHTRRDDPALDARVPFGPNVTVAHVDAGPPRELPKDDLLPHMHAFGERLHAAWRKNPPDVVHAHFWMSGMAALSAARRLGIPVVQTFHALGTVKKRHQGREDTSPVERIMHERRIARDADRILATCSDEVTELTRMGARLERITVVPCGVDLEHFTPTGPVADRREGFRRILAVGRLVRRKGVADVIRALPAVPDTELLVVGGPSHGEVVDDPEVQRLMSIAEEQGVRDRVVFRGRVARPDMPALLRSADAVVCAPWYEPFGIVPLEAMACGVPVVATAVGGMLDTVVDQVTGIHVPPRDPVALGEALRSLLADRARCEAFGRAGVTRARALYGWGTVAAGTLACYRELVLADDTVEVAL